MKRLVLIVYSIIAATIAIDAQNKVFWVHGLNDNRSNIETSQVWYVYKHSLNDVDNQGRSLQWDGRYTINNASADLNDIINSDCTSSEQAIVIGHSAGGLVARNAANSNPKIRAIVTAGTPNKGAGVVTALKNGSAYNVADRAIQKVSTAIVASSAAITVTFTGLSGLILTICDLSDILIEKIGIALAKPKLDEYLTSFTSELSVLDMDPDTTRNIFLRTLNSAPVTVPIINIYGNEDGNRLVRLAGTAMHKAEVDSYLNTSDKTYDDSAFKYYDGTIAVATAAELLHATTAVAYGVAAVWNPSLAGSSAINIAATVAWADVRRFIQYDVRNEWDKMIGAYHIESVEKWHHFLWWKWSDVTEVLVYDDSDGFIPNSSSKMDNVVGPNIINREVNGVNHLEMNSHPAMRSLLSQIFNGSYGDAFNPKKNVD